MKLVRTIFVGTACLLFASCGEMYMLKQDTKPEIKPSQTMAKLVIIRTTSFGFAVKIDNFVDGKFIGQTQGKSFFITEVEPGTHYVIAASENNACARLNFEAGKLYYLMQAIYPGIMFARTGFGTMTPEEADKEIKEAKYFIIDPAKKGKDLDAESYKKTCADFDKEAKEDPDRHKDVLNYKGY
jgi:Protein of unknown function (DUF2846)